VTTYNVYCDESGHLANDDQPNMVLGALWTSTPNVRRFADEIRALKKQHGLSPQFEVKWTKVSPGKTDFYLALIDFFFDRPELRFRALVVPDKSKLNHAAFGQDHDTWYYKMYFSLLKAIIARDHKFRIYLDIKDTRSAAKMLKLHEVLSNSVYDFDKRTIERVQTVRSHEVELLQLTDILIGAIQYVGRGAATSTAKQRLVRRIQERTGLTLQKSTLITESKFNLFVWRAQEKFGEG